MSLNTPKATTKKNNNQSMHQHQQQQNTEEQEQKLSLLKKQVQLSKSQLLELAYDDQKFVSKLQELNNLGYEAMTVQQNFSQASIYLTAAQNILQYAASCGKTIDRNLIIGTLQNQACVFHRMWELQKSINYIEAIIYNITTFLQNQHGIDFKLPALQQHSQQNIKTSIYLKNKLHLVFYYLQFCAVSSQNQSHETALSAASKALNMIKEVCQQEYNLQRVARKNGVFYTTDQEHIQMLLQLYNIKDSYEQSNSVQKQQPIEKTIQKFLIKAKRTYQRFKTKLPQRKQRYPKICSQLQHYSIGYVMQINPTKLQKKPQMLDLKQQLQYINKIYKAIYISICHFTMATELRLMSGQKFPIDPQMRRASYQFKSSQLHHLIGIITAGLYIPCETVYFQHILNSFKNHYSIDLTQKDSQISVTSENWNDQDDDLIHLQTSSLNLKKDTNQSMDSNDLLTNTKLKNSQHNASLGSPQLYSKMKKGMSKNKPSSNKQSQKSLKKSGHQPQQTQRMKSKSKEKQKLKSNNINKKSNLKQSSKSRKKSSRKIQQKLKSPSIHKKPDININTLKKVSDVKQKKNTDMKVPTSRSKTKSRKKMSRSKYQLEDSKEKITMTRSNHNFIPTPSSSKKLLPPSLNSLKYVEKQKVQKITQKLQKKQKDNIPITKTLSNNVYIQRSNNQLNKQKVGMKKQSSGITSISNSMTNSQAVSQKLITLKKNKSPQPINVTEKQSRSAKKNNK